jgi:hypothetical protein
MPHPRRERGVVSVKKVLWFLVGIAGGFVLAHLVDKDPRGHDLLAQVDARISEFTDRMSAAYHEQEARFTEVPDAPASASSPSAPESPSA